MVFGGKKSKNSTEQADNARLLTIINNLADATFSTDENGKILMYNAASLDLLDTNQDLTGKQLSTLFTLHDSDDKKINMTTLLKEATKETRRDDLIHTYSDGETIRIELTYAPIKSTFSKQKGETIIGYVLIARDITKQKSLEEERDEFISVISHELRTPVTIVEGDISNIQLMLDQPELPDMKVIKKALKSSHDHILYLARMVNDLSTLSRAERGVGEAPESINVVELIHALHHRYSEDAKSKKLALDIDITGKPGYIHASRLYVEELLQNFITNAIRYTKEGTITLMANQKDGMIRFTVKDTGIGISRSDQQKIFKKFWRSEDYRIRETNGTGLGLYVASKLARKLKTQITLTSRLNHGSSFSFELPSSDPKSSTGA